MINFSKIKEGYFVKVGRTIIVEFKEKWYHSLVFSDNKCYEMTDIDDVYPYYNQYDEMKTK